MSKKQQSKEKSTSSNKKDKKTLTIPTLVREKAPSPKKAGKRRQPKKKAHEKAHEKTHDGSSRTRPKEHTNIRRVELTVSAKGLDHKCDHAETVDYLQHSPVGVRQTHEPRPSLKRMLDEPIGFERACHLSGADEDRVLKKRKLIHNLSDEHRTRRKELGHVPTKFSTSLERSKPVGFHNPNNMCYRRSVMQSLVNIPLFANWLQDYFEVHKCKHLATERACMLCTFKNLLDHYASSNPNVRKAVEEFDRTIKAAGRDSCYDWTASTEQADASELILFLVQNFAEQAESPEAIRALFQTQLVSEWTCEDCCEISTGAPVDETFLSVSIDPKTLGKGKKPLLEDYIAQYFVDEAPEVACERCKLKRDRKRAVRINAAPAVLFVVMKRFQFDLYGRSSKIKTKVPYQQHLDLSRFATNPDLRQPDGIRYKLASVVAHSGDLKKGHYITFGEDLVSGQIFQFNDATVSKASKEALLDPPKGFTPYILTYVSCGKEAAEKK